MWTILERDWKYGSLFAELTAFVATFDNLATYYSDVRSRSKFAVWAWKNLKLSPLTLLLPIVAVFTVIPILLNTLQRKSGAIICLAETLFALGIYGVLLFLVQLAFKTSVNKDARFDLMADAYLELCNVYRYEPRKVLEDALVLLSNWAPLADLSIAIGVVSLSIAGVFVETGQISTFWMVGLGIVVVALYTLKAILIDVSAQHIKQIQQRYQF